MGRTQQLAALVGAFFVVVAAMCWVIADAPLPAGAGFTAALLLMWASAG